mmetsp:Transcript_7897/g.12891  ORF Transcript_7897/g.12891 Transcript_7897/m.12891 type:complete len:108 (+) Transcript_7897:107-430(+)
MLVLSHVARQVLVAIVFLTSFLPQAGCLLVAGNGKAQGHDRVALGEFPSKAEACEACKKNNCKSCYAVICPGGCSIVPPVAGPDFQWFCEMISGVSPWPGVRQQDKC